MLSLDLETHKIQAGLLAPPGICGATARDTDKPLLLLFPDVLKHTGRWLSAAEAVCGANIAYDFGVIAAAKPELIPIIFDKYERGEVFDIQLAAALDAIAAGTLFRHPVTGAPLGRYSLETCVSLFLGRDDAKANNAWVLRYHELENVPLSEWPPEAIQYPLDDALNTLKVAQVLQKRGKNLGLMMLGDSPHPLGITHMTHQARSALAMHFAGVWGLRTDPVAVAKLRAEIEEQYAAIRVKFQDCGFFRDDGSKNTAVIKRRVVLAYGGSADRTCTECAGTGKVPSLKNPKNKINCERCSGTGLEIPNACPRTAGAGISADRDTLSESGDDLLDEFSMVSMTDKIRSTYLPFLEQGTKLPLTLRSNNLIESGRASYEGVIQLLPRKGGIRECFVARPGYVFCSVDYGALELCTFAQVCLWVLGESRMAEEINKAKDPGILHTILGARMIGAQQDEFIALCKSGDADALAKRQMAKALNFGRLGGMGAAKLVLSKRKEGLRFCIAQGIATTCGTTKIMEWNGYSIPPVCLACVEVAHELIGTFEEEWPEVKLYHRWTSEHEGITEGLATNFLPGTGFERGKLHFTDFANQGFQGLAAAGAKHALWLVTKECFTDQDSPLYGSHPIVFAHDEIITELLEDRAHEAAHRQAQIQIDAMRAFVPDVYIAAEPAIARRWYKEMKPVYEDGRLVPWEPK